MLPMGTFAAWAPDQIPPRKALTVLTDREPNVVGQRRTSKPKLKIRKTRRNDENKHPSGGTFTSLFRTTSSESGYMSVASPISPGSRSKDDRPSTSMGVAPSSSQKPESGAHRRRSVRERVFSKVREGLQKRASETSTASISSSFWTQDFYTARESLGSTQSSATHQSGLLLRATLSAAAEVEAFDLTKGGTIWTAVQIRGEVFDKENTEVPFLNRGLDVAVIVDNSKFSSVQCLERACSQVIHLAELLQNPGDRLAVFSTVCQHEPDTLDSPGGCMLHALASPNTRTLENELRAMMERARSTVLFNPSFLDTLVAAHNSFESVGEWYDANSRRAIVVLTPNPAALVQATLITPLRIHVICPGILPFSSPPPGKLRGWLLNAGQTSLPDNFEERADRFGLHLRDIDDLIACERSICNIGEINNLLLYVRAGAGAIIEEVVGDLYHHDLLPGQTISLLVKVKVRPLVPANDPLTNLELMLGEVLSELLQIELVHEHSLFPGSEVATRTSCWLLRYNGENEQHTHHSRVRNERRSSWIRGLRAYQQACTRPHRDALNALEKLLRRDDFRHCHRYIRCLTEEVRFQMGVAADEYLMTHVEREDADSPATIIHRRV